MRRRTEGSINFLRGHHCVNRHVPRARVHLGNHTWSASVPSRMPITKIIRNTSEPAPEMFHRDMFMAVNAASHPREPREARVMSAVSDLQCQYMTLPIASKTANTQSLSSRAVSSVIRVAASNEPDDAKDTHSSSSASLNTSTMTSRVPRDEIPSLGIVGSTLPVFLARSMDRVTVDTCQILVARTGRARTWRSVETLDNNGRLNEVLWLLLEDVHRRAFLPLVKRMYAARNRAVALRSGSPSHSLSL